MAEWSDTTYDENTKFTIPLPDERFLLSLPKNIRILDAGCGYGRVLRYLSGLGFKNLAGFDVSPDYVARAKEICPEVEILVSDFKNFNLKNKYDLILLMGVIEYVLSNKEQDIFFAKISKILSDNGYVLLETFILDLKANWKQYMAGFVKTMHPGRFKNSKGFKCYHQSAGHLKRVLKKYFIIEHNEKKHYLTWTDNVCKGHYFVLRKK